MAQHVDLSESSSYDDMKDAETAFHAALKAHGPSASETAAATEAYKAEIRKVLSDCKVSWSL